MYGKIVLKFVYSYILCDEYTFVQRKLVVLLKIQDMANNKYKLQFEDIKDLIKPMGYCIASDRITVDGEKVGFMYREEKEDEDDSGWRFLAGDESDEYLEDTHHFMMFDINYVANLDSAIIPYLKRKIGTELERIEGTDEFQNY